MKKSILLVVLLIIELCGCTTFIKNYKKGYNETLTKLRAKEEIPKIQDTFIIDYSFDKVWKVLMETLAERSYPIKTIEKESGFITTNFMKIGTDSRYSSNFIISKIDETITTLKIISTFEQFYNYSWHWTYSKGIIEKNIYDSVMLKIKRYESK